MTRVILVTDIFGLNNTIVRACDGFTLNGHEVECISPYCKTGQFSNEDEAYTAFQSEGGMPAYIEKVEQVMQQSDNSSMVVGFSAGASALWALSHRIEYSKALLFYPGQIRYYLDVTPKSRPLIVFPNQEAHFDLQQVINKINAENSADVLQIRAQHGFVNPSSRGYDSQLSDAVFQFLRHWPRIPKERDLEIMTSALKFELHNNKKDNNG